jgi:hypothetical protein
VPQSSILKFLARQVQRRPRLGIAILVLGIFTLWELAADQYLQPNSSQFSRYGWRYFAIYHTGDFNNSFSVAILIYAFFRWLTVGRFPSLILGFLLTFGVFLTIERNDPLDLPFAVLGLALYLYATSQPPRFDG